MYDLLLTGYIIKEMIFSRAAGQRETRFLLPLCWFVAVVERASFVSTITVKPLRNSSVLTLISFFVSFGEQTLAVAETTVWVNPGQSQEDAEIMGSLGEKQFIT